MGKIKAYIINLESSHDRYEYMQEVMRPFDCFDVEFVKAVDGRKLDSREIAAVFCQEVAKEHYGRELRGGEIGCTLSHKKCAQLLLDSSLPYALFLEDDLVWQTKSFVEILPSLSKCLATDTPTVILLSGDYWYTGKRPLSDRYELATVHDAVCTQSYFINRAGAEYLLKLGNWHLADDWRALRKSGVHIKALYPHVADQNRSELDTVIAPIYGGINRTQMTFHNVVDSYIKSISNRLLVKLHHFEAKDFVWKQ